MESAVSMNPDGSGAVEVCKACRGAGRAITVDDLCSVCKGSGYPTWSKEHHEHPMITKGKV